MAKQFKVDIDDAEMRAFEIIVPDPVEWVENAIRNKVRKCLTYVTEQVAGNTLGLLSVDDRQEIEADLIAAGDVMKQPKHYSEAVKKKIALKSKLDTRVERDQKEHDKMVAGE
jgi:hypothetical protein